MGGDSYDRDVSSSSSSSSKSFGGATSAYKPQKVAVPAATRVSQQAQQKMSKILPTPDMIPAVKGRITCTHRNPIVIGFDHTGSMGEAALVAYDKFPMFWDQLIKKGYLSDPSVSFFGVGDIRSDRYPLQLCEFAESTALDPWLERLYLEGKGGGQGSESYEYFAYYYAYCVDLPNATLPFLFLFGDEDYVDTLSTSNIQTYCDKSYKGGSLDARVVFAELRKKFNVFHLHQPYTDWVGNDADIIARWKAVLGNERVQIVKDPKAIVDMMLGIIALLSETRTLDDYVVDMKARGQDAGRIQLVSAELAPLEKSLVKVDNALSTAATVAATSRVTKSKRL
jgi:hypothetical protein